MRLRVLKRQGGSFIELPQELAERDEIELFQLKPGYYLLSLPLQQTQETRADEQPKPQSRRSLNEAERSVLTKLLSIRFEQRVPERVMTSLDDKEKLVLQDLERKGFVNVFHGTKYKEGVYNIPDSIYPILSQKGNTGQEQPQQPQAPETTSNDLLVILKRQGYIVINDRNQARALSESLSQEMKNGSVAGVKGFDNKFYIVTRAYLDTAQIAIGRALKEDMDAQSVSAATRLDAEGCMAVLRIMSEAGEILEKKKGVFAPV